MGSVVALAFLATLSAMALRFSRGRELQLKRVPVRAMRRRP